MIKGRREALRIQQDIIERANNMALSNPYFARRYRRDRGLPDYLRILERSDHHRIFMEKLGHILESGGGVLDVGCGQGIFLRDLVNRNKRLTLCGVDLQDPRTLPPNVHFVRGSFLKHDTLRNLLQIAPKGFDMITAFYVFPYLHDPLLGLKHVYRLLKKGIGHSFIHGVPMAFVLPRKSDRRYLKECLVAQGHLVYVRFALHVFIDSMYEVWDIVLKQDGTHPHLRLPVTPTDKRFPLRVLSSLDPILYQVYTISGQK